MNVHYGLGEIKPVKRKQHPYKPPEQQSRKHKHKKKQSHRTPMEELYHLIKCKDRDAINELVQMQHPVALILKANPKYELSTKQIWWMVYCIRDGYKPVDDSIQPNEDF